VRFFARVLFPYSSAPPSRAASSAHRPSSRVASKAKNPYGSYFFVCLSVSFIPLSFVFHLLSFIIFVLCGRGHCSRPRANAAADPRRLAFLFFSAWRCYFPRGFVPPQAAAVS
jgi:hypothetical protein